MNGAAADTAACAILGVDAWGLERLISQGDVEALGEPGARHFDADALQAGAAERRRRRDAALKSLAELDGPHLGGGR